MICTLNNKPSLTLNRSFIPDIPETVNDKPLNAGNISLNTSDNQLSIHLQNDG